MTHPASTQTNWKADSRRFDGVADLYDTYRPGYPEELLDTLIASASLRPDSKILEIGSGTGKATLMLARRGLSVQCIEPGRNLVAVAAQNLRDFPQVTFRTVTFEEWPARSGEFDLVLSAQAFHWIPKDIGYTKAAQALKDRGHLALIWNMPPDPAGSADPAGSHDPAGSPDLAGSADPGGGIFLEMEEVYRTCAPELGDRPYSCEALIRQRERDIWESNVFCNVRTSRFPWSTRYDVQSYLGLLNTYSDHLRLPESRRESLYQGITEIIRNHGGYLEKPYLTVLYLAQKAV